MDSSGSVFSRRPSFFSKTRHKHKASLLPPELLLPPASPITEHPAPASPTTPPAATATASQYDAPARPPTTPQKRARQRHSISSTVGDLSLQLRRSRSTSLRSAASSSHTRQRSTSTMHSVSSPDRTVPPAAPLAASRPTLSISTFARSKPKSSDSVKPDAATPHFDKTPLADKPKAPFMAATRSASNAGLAPAAPIPVPNGANPNIVFQHIHELASKRISTLDYLRKACVPLSLYYATARH